MHFLLDSGGYIWDPSQVKRYMVYYRGFIVFLQNFRVDSSINMQHIGPRLDYKAPLLQVQIVTKEDSQIKTCNVSSPNRECFSKLIFLGNFVSTSLNHYPHCDAKFLQNTKFLNRISPIKAFKVSCPN